MSLAAYYTMGEPEGSTQANDSSGAGADPLVITGDGPAVVFGSATGPPTDGLTAVQFAAGQYLMGSPAVVGPITTLVLQCFFNTTDTGNYIIDTLGEEGLHSLALVMQAGGILRGLVDGTANVVVDSTTAVNDGATHHAMLVAENGVGATLYIDGVAEDTDATANTLDTELTRVVVGTQALDPGTSPFTGTVAHVAIGTAVPTPAQIATIAAAGLDGHAGETTDERLIRYASWGHIPAAEVVTTASPITLDHISSEGQQVVELMRKVETSEAGVLHDDRDGNLRLRTRAARYNLAPAVTLDAADGRVGVDYSPRVDRQVLKNDAEGKNLDGSITATATDEASRQEYGDHLHRVETAAQDPNEPLALASWAVGNYAEPTPRAPTVTVNLLKYITPSADDTAPLLALDIGSKVRIENAPSQAPAQTVDYFVEGYTETLGVAVWTLTLNLSPTLHYDDVFTLDSATDGVLDQNRFAL